MVFASIREHAEHCYFFASTSRNKKFGLRACEQRKNLGSTRKRALVEILRANRAKVEEDSGLQTNKNEGTTGGQQRGNKLWRT